MKIIHGYRDDKNLRDSFNELAEQTFDGLNFEGWYQNGFWGDDYDPHSIVVDGRVVANVSVNRTDLVFGGRRHRVLQLGTVMTAPEYRGRGLSRAIMEYILDHYADAEGIYLFANDSVVDFYPRFGFRLGVEYAYERAVACRGADRTEQVPMDGPAAWARLKGAMERSSFRSGCAMVDNPGLIFFYVSQFMQDAVYFIPELDAWVVAQREEGVLTVHNIFGPEGVSVEQVVRAFGSVDRVKLGFAPESPEGWEIQPVGQEDCHFFVRGGAFEGFMQRRLRIPSLSHA